MARYGAFPNDFSIIQLFNMVERSTTIKYDHEWRFQMPGFEIRTIVAYDIEFG